MQKINTIAYCIVSINFEDIAKLNGIVNVIQIDKIGAKAFFKLMTFVCILYMHVSCRMYSIEKNLFNKRYDFLENLFYDLPARRQPTTELHSC